MDRRPKTIFQLDTPYTAAQFPQISAQQQETILELLCSILSPIGQHRINHVQTSKGKRRSRKRKRGAAGADDAKPEPHGGPPPPAPNVAPFVVVGLNCITKRLSLLSRASKPPGISEGVLDAATGERLEGNNADVNVKEGMPGHDDDAVTEETPGRNGDDREEWMPDRDDNDIKEGIPDLPTPHFTSIFVPRTSSQPSLLHDHLPQLIATASLAHPHLPATRLVSLPKGSETRLAAALALPRVSFIGLLHDMPRSDHLLSLIRTAVPEIQIPWLLDAATSYLPMQVNAIQTFITVKPKARS